MKIDGINIAKDISIDLKKKVIKLKKIGCQPHLAVILVGKDPASLSFIKQKNKAARTIKAKCSLHQFPKTPLYQKIAEHILKLARDKKVHGIIIQRPLPASLSAYALCRCIPAVKDIDGFSPQSPYPSPIGAAVFKVLNQIYYSYILNQPQPEKDFSPLLNTWLKKQHIVLIGRGATGGKPIGEMLARKRINFINIHSSTHKPEEYLLQADIIISAVGKPQVVTPEMIKKDCILIGVGLCYVNHRIKGDYDEKAIKDKTSFYTPTPGGTGPVNVACLMQNLVSACQKQVK